MALTCNQETSSPQQHGIMVTQEYSRTRKGNHRRLRVHQRPTHRHGRQYLHQIYGQRPTESSIQSSFTSYASITAPSSSRTLISQRLQKMTPTAADQGTEQASLTASSSSSQSSSSINGTYNQISSPESFYSYANE